MHTFLLLCRPGFEGDCAAELAARDPGGYARAVPEAGWLEWHSAIAGPCNGLIFPRTGFRVTARLEALPERDRLGVLLPALAGLGPVSSVRLEHPDTNEGRGLQRFFRHFRGTLEAALRRDGILRPEAENRCLHLFFTDSSRVVLGISRGEGAGPWENGVPRLRLPSGAPSRSALKIEEAWLRLMSHTERDYWLRAGGTAVDLGAAPGGWTWQLARQGLRVTAVDHGKLARHLMEEYPVRHESADAFTWRPPVPVDLVVCDVVDKPARTLALMEKWLRQGWAAAALFNLKLPMKKRYLAVAELLERLSSAVVPGHRVRAAQLYHDREEITVVVLPADRPGA